MIGDERGEGTTAGTRTPVATVSLGDVPKEMPAIDGCIMRM